MSENDSKFSSEILPFQSFDLGEFVVRAIQNDPALQPSTKNQYIKAIENYLATGGSLTDPQALIEYALHSGQLDSFLPGRDCDPLDPGTGAAGQGKRRPENITEQQAAGTFKFETTQDYLNIELDLDTTTSDFVPFLPSPLTSFSLYFLCFCSMLKNANSPAVSPSLLADLRHLLFM